MINIYDGDGEKIIKFIQQNFSSDLPKNGFLAGQAVCGVLMYLKGLSKEIVLNDIDIFHIVQKFSNSYSQQKFNSFQIVNGLSLDRKTLQAFKTSEDKSIFESKSKDIIQNYYSQLGDMETDTEDYADALKRLEKAHTRNVDIVNGYLSYYHSTSNDTYRICDVFRKGLINSVIVQSPNGDYSSILKGFDINCTQVGVCLTTKKIYFTPHFLMFLNSLKLEVTNATRPSHTLIRLIKKQNELGLNFDEERTLSALNMSILLNNSKFRENILEPELELVSLLKTNIFSSDVMAYKIPKMGKVYLEKYGSVKHLMPGYHLEEFNYSPKSSSDEESKQSLYDLTTTLELPDYITSGIHREMLEKRLKCKVIGYAGILKEHAVSIINHYYSNNKNVLIPVSFTKKQAQKSLVRQPRHSEVIKDLIALKDVKIEKGLLNSKQYNKVSYYPEFWSKLESLQSKYHQNVYSSLISFIEDNDKLYRLYRDNREYLNKPYIDIEGSFTSQDSALRAVERFKMDIKSLLSQSHIRRNLLIDSLTIDGFEFSLVNTFLEHYDFYKDLYDGYGINRANNVYWIRNCSKLPITITKDDKVIGKLCYVMYKYHDDKSRLSIYNRYAFVLDSSTSENELRKLATKYLFKLSELGIINEIKKVYDKIGNEY
ncbi:hypothetical protein ACXHQ0_18890 [Vibrio antiquarius]|uniref:Uncharacterized protein n=1 Tax=Vibrio parahaemolyticus TaxID=670 RepID=A0AA46UT91_VIBPH|nr:MULTISPECIES: hypothetical protein [Vibrio harveyi group]KOE87664.1 hypothetical protein ACS91_12895 [Vibrio parahaemolyticus]MCS0313609.1 hypothetical protein [Vibrio diabolicus]UYV30304.1 hypothetical protein M5598_25180 [Vibrio parahaemolyticus]UYW19687.1 hypothetical protein IF561_25475 [Vibrio parahaemolyticus]